MQNESDVIVVGGGGSGLIAALTAARLGRHVVLIEKERKLGGTTALSVGSISTSSTPQQAMAGFNDSPAEHFEDMEKFAGELAPRDNLELRRVLAENVPEAMLLLSDLGLRFIGPIPEPPHRYPRLHAVLPRSLAFVRSLEKACRRAGVDIRCSTAAKDLIIENGGVRGVEVERDGRASSLRARLGVILAAGDFSSAPRAYKERFMKGALLDVSGANPASTGDGHVLGEKAGGRVVNGDLALGPEIRFIRPERPHIIARLPASPLIGLLTYWAMKLVPERILRPLLVSLATTYLAPSHGLFAKGAILVNSRGERFCDERDRPQDRMPYESDGLAWIVFDQTMAELFSAWPNYVSTAPVIGYAYVPDYLSSRRDISSRHDSLAHLESAKGFAPGALQRTIAAYNAVANGDRPPILKPPFYCLGPARSWLLLTEGGLRVDAGMRVLGNDDDKPIPGLYAAGSNGQGGVLLEGHGNHLGWAFTSGRIAGRSVALSDPRR